MSKAWHKPKPTPPNWYWLDSDGCWWCKYRNNQKGCTGCKILKRIVAEQKERQRKKEKHKFDF